MIFHINICVPKRLSTIVMSLIIKYESQIAKASHINIAEKKTFIILLLLLFSFPTFLVRILLSWLFLVLFVIFKFKQRWYFPEEYFTLLFYVLFKKNWFFLFLDILQILNRFRFMLNIYPRVECNFEWNLLIDGKAAWLRFWGAVVLYRHRYCVKKIMEMSGQAVSNILTVLIFGFKILKFRTQTAHFWMLCVKKFIIFQFSNITSWLKSEFILLMNRLNYNIQFLFKFCTKKL